MAKRPADEPLEATIAAHSPASKRARVDDVADQDLPPPPPPPEDPVANGRAAQNGVSSTHNGAGEDATRSDDLEDEDLDQPVPSARQREPTKGYSDLYLDTINRARLDFDFEKLCSVTLSNINVYACLVCGKYFGGRGHKTPAYFHALEVGHHVYINMETKKVYVLPEGYEVKSDSLKDIKIVVDPKFTL
jgi:U4/U6.U5 tri-snRNP-associated protein 2